MQKMHSVYGALKSQLPSSYRGKCAQVPPKLHAQSLMNNRPILLISFKTWRSWVGNIRGNSYSSLKNLHLIYAGFYPHLSTHL